jgi:Trk K+ transport system NAD-binding subunit
VVLFPTTGDRLLCLVDAAGERADTQTAEPAGRTRALPGRPRFGALRRIDRRFWVLGGVLALITFGSAMVFSATTNIDIVESIYDVVGAFFGGVDPSVANGNALKIFAIFLTLVGAAALAVFYGLIADVVLSTRISNFLGPQPTDADHHVIVVGLGTIGFRIAAMLRERDIPVVAAERQADGRFVDAAREMRIAVVNTDARTQQALRALGVERARALVAATDDDAANLTSALLARSMRPDMRIVVRLFDPDLAAQLESAMGDYNSRSVSALAAPAFAAAAVGRRVLATIPVGHRRLLIVARVPVEAGSPADGSTIGVEEEKATHVELGGCQVLAIVVGDEVHWAPDDNDPVTAGMELLVVATRRGLATAVRRSAGPHAEGFGDIEHDAEQGADEGAAPGSETDAREDVSQPASA